MTVHVLREVICRQKDDGSTTIIFENLYDIAKDYDAASKIVREWHKKDYHDFSLDVKMIFIKIGLPKMINKYCNDFLGSKHYENGYIYRIDAYPYKVKE